MLYGIIIVLNTKSSRHPDPQAQAADVVLETLVKTAHTIPNPLAFAPKPGKRKQQTRFSRL